MFTYLIFYKYYIIIYNIYQDFNLSKLAEIIVSKTNRVEVLDILSLGLAGFEPAEYMGLDSNIGLCTNHSSNIITESHVPYLLATAHYLTYYKYYSIIFKNVNQLYLQHI